MAETFYESSNKEIAVGVHLVDIGGARTVAHQHNFTAPVRVRARLPPFPARRLSLQVGCGRLT